MEFGGYEYSGFASVMPKVTEDTGLASSSVATDGNRVCAIFATGDVVCADMMVNSYGLRIWGFRIIIMVSYPLSLFSAIRFSYNTIIIKIRN